MPSGDKMEMESFEGPFDEEDEVLNTFIDALCDCGAGGSPDAVAAGLKRAYSVFVGARIARGHGRATALAEGKVILKGFVEAKNTLSRGALTADSSC